MAECNFKPNGQRAFKRGYRKRDGRPYGVSFIAGDKCGQDALVSRKVDGAMQHRCLAHLGQR